MSTETKHTPGPWDVVADTYPGMVDVVAADGRKVAGPFILTATDLTFADYQRCTADAHLIAAAPEMLEALRVVTNTDDHADPEVRAIVRAALAKATGGAR